LLSRGAFGYVFLDAMSSVSFLTSFYYFVSLYFANVVLSYRFIYDCVVFLTKCRLDVAGATSEFIVPVLETFC